MLIVSALYGARSQEFHSSRHMCCDDVTKVIWFDLWDHIPWRSSVWGFFIPLDGARSPHSPHLTEWQVGYIVLLNMSVLSIYLLSRSNIVHINYLHIYRCDQITWKGHCKVGFSCPAKTCVALFFLLFFFKVGFSCPAKTCVDLGHTSTNYVLNRQKYNIIIITFVAMLTPNKKLFSKLGLTLIYIHSVGKRVKIFCWWTPHVFSLQY